MKISVKGKYASVKLDLVDDDHFWGHYVDKMKALIQQCGDVVKAIDNQEESKPHE